MCAGNDHQPGRHVALELLVEQRLVALESVDGSADHEGRHLDIPGTLERRACRPEVAVVGSVPGHSGCRVVDHRQEEAVHRVDMILRRRADLLGILRVGLDLGLVVDAQSLGHRQPVGNQQCVDQAAGAEHAAPGIAHRHADEGGLDGRVALCGGVQGADAEVGGAGDADLAVRPRLLHHPGDGVGIGGLFVRPPQIGLAAGNAGAERIHDDGGIAAADHVAVGAAEERRAAGRQQRGDGIAEIGAVGGLAKDRREGAGDGITIGVGRQGHQHAQLLTAARGDELQRQRDDARVLGIASIATPGQVGIGGQRGIVGAGRQARAERGRGALGGDARVAGRRDGGGGCRGAGRGTPRTGFVVAACQQGDDHAEDQGCASACVAGQAMHCVLLLSGAAVIAAAFRHQGP